MYRITFNNYQGTQQCLSEDEAILTALLKSNISGVRYGCQMGICYQCLMELEKGELDWIDQNEQKELDLRENEFLACQCRAKSDIQIKQ